MPHHHYNHNPITITTSLTLFVSLTMYIITLMREKGEIYYYYSWERGERGVLLLLAGLPRGIELAKAKSQLFHTLTSFIALKIRFIQTLCSQKQAGEVEKYWVADCSANWGVGGFWPFLSWQNLVQQARNDG